MRVYIINFISLMMVGLLAERYMRHKAVARLYCFYVWLQMTLIAAVRWGNGIDYNYYYNNFYKLAYAQGWSEVIQHQNEIGYAVFTRSISFFTENIIVYLFLFYGAVYGLLMLYIYKYCEIKWIAVTAFIAFDYFAMSFCFMRQSMAMVIGLFVLELVKQRRITGAILLTVTASLFHTAALSLLLYMLVSCVDFSNKNIRLGAVITSAAFYIGFDFILEHLLVGPFAKYSGYIGTEFMNGNHILVVFYPVFVFAMVMLFHKQLLKRDEEIKYLIPVMFLGVVFSIMTTKHYVIERVGLYVTLYNIRTVSQIVSLFKEGLSKLYYRLAIASTLLICMGAFVFGMQNDRYWILPYRVNETYLNEVELIRIN